MSIFAAPGDAAEEQLPPCHALPAALPELVAAARAAGRALWHFGGGKSGYPLDKTDTSSYIILDLRFYIGISRYILYYLILYHLQLYNLGSMVFYVFILVYLDISSIIWSFPHIIIIKDVIWLVVTGTMEFD